MSYLSINSHFVLATIQLNIFTRAVCILNLLLFQNILGLHGIPSQFFLEVYYTFDRIPEARIGDVILGLLCLILLVLLVFMKATVDPGDSPDSNYTRVSRKLVWTVATSQYLSELD